MDDDTIANIIAAAAAAADMAAADDNMRRDAQWSWPVAAPSPSQAGSPYPFRHLLDLPLADAGSSPLPEAAPAPRCMGVMGVHMVAVPTQQATAQAHEGEGDDQPAQPSAPTVPPVVFAPSGCTPPDPWHPLLHEPMYLLPSLPHASLLQPRYSYDSTPHPTQSGATGGCSHMGGWSQPGGSGEDRVWTEEDVCTSASCALASQTESYGGPRLGRPPRPFNCDTLSLAVAGVLGAVNPGARHKRCSSDGGMAQSVAGSGIGGGAGGNGTSSSASRHLPIPSLASLVSVLAHRVLPPLCEPC